MARAGRQTKQTSARERARLARQQVDAERDKRDREIEEEAADFFVALDEHNKVEEQLATIEPKMATAVGQLLDIRESAPRISALLGIEVKEVRRLGVERDRRRDEEAEEHADGPDRGDTHN